MTTSAQISALRSNSDDLVKRFLGDLFTILSRMDGRPPIYVRDVLLELYPQMLEPYREVAAQMYASWYEEVRAATVGGAFVASSAVAPLTSAQTAANVRWGVAPLFGQGDSTPLMLLGGSAQRQILDAGRSTIDLNAQRDPVTVSWSRVARPGACKFCQMLAGRGPVYRSSAAAGIDYRVNGSGEPIEANRYHDHCRCTLKPTWYEIGSYTDPGTGVEQPALVPIPD